MANVTESDVSSLLAQIERLGKSLFTGSRQDVETRKHLRIATHNPSRAMEEPGDIVERFCFSVRSSPMIGNYSSTSTHIFAKSDDLIQSMEEVSIRIAIDLDLFNILFNARKPQTLDDLTRVTRADAVLLGMLLSK